MNCTFADGKVLDGENVLSAELSNPQFAKFLCRIEYSHEPVAVGMFLSPKSVLTVATILWLQKTSNARRNTQNFEMIDKTMLKVKVGYALLPTDYSLESLVVENVKSFFEHPHFASVHNILLLTVSYHNKKIIF